MMNYRTISIRQQCENVHSYLTFFVTFCPFLEPAACRFYIGYLSLLFCARRAMLILADSKAVYIQLQPF